MDDHRLAADTGSVQMQAERALLQLSGFRLVVIVEPRLANGYGMSMPQFGQQPVERRLAIGRQIPPVHAHRPGDPRVTPSRGAARSAIVRAAPDTEQATD